MPTTCRPLVDHLATTADHVFPPPRLYPPVVVDYGRRSAWGFAPRTTSGESVMTRSEARASGAKYYFTGHPCLRGHIGLRRTANYTSAPNWLPDQRKLWLGERLTQTSGGSKNNDGVNVAR
jgi:hypothetical protein